MVQEDMKVVEEHRVRLADVDGGSERVRWADMGEDSAVGRVSAVAAEEQREQGKAGPGGELELAEEREQQGEAVWELAVMKERECGRRAEKGQEGEGDVVKGVSEERESSERRADIWVSDVCPKCEGEVFLPFL